MNRKINKIVFSIVALCCATTFSCVDVLDVNETRSLSDLAIWSSEESVDRYVVASYMTFKDESQVSSSRERFYDSYSDLMKSSSWDQWGHQYNRALLSPNFFQKGNANGFDIWADAYGRIRRANVLLDQITEWGVPRFGNDWCDIRRAEVRLCRAFSYYRLIRVYGGVIIRTELTGVDGGLDDGAIEANIHRARATEAESWKFVLDELEWAAERLPESWSTQWTGRATKKTAYGLISRMALFAKEWQMAVNAAEEVKRLGGDLAADYAKLFQVDGGQDNSKELLFTLYFLKDEITHNFDLRNRPFGDRTTHTDAVTLAEHVPTAELADLYEFSDSTPFSWDTWHTLGYADPYTQREPRFHATIFANGSPWEGRNIETFVGGTDEFTAFQTTIGFSTNGKTSTGYYLRKYLQEGHNFSTNQSYQHDAVLRYAEVLLNKAEAYAELDYAANSAQALAALNEVRARVKLDPRTAAEAPDKEAFMELLRRERAVELAGEGFRFWDLKRWRLAETVIDGQSVHGVRITGNSVANFIYARVNADDNQTRIFPERYYYLSLPSAEVANNNLCVDNDGW